METNALVLSIAQACHQANKAWCEANNDFSQKKLGRSRAMATR